MPTSQERTRRHLVDAAIGVWAADSGASLGRVAAAAGVGRTTVHRHFAERAALVAAVDRECRERFEGAAVRSRPDDGTGREALLRLAAELVGLGDALGLIFADRPVVDPDRWEPELFVAAIERGRADGSIDPGLPAHWPVTLTWTTLFAGWLAVSSGAAGRHEAGELVVRTLGRGIAPA